MLSVGLGLLGGLGLILVMEQWQSATRDPYIARKKREIISMMPGVSSGRLNPFGKFIPSFAPSLDTINPGQASQAKADQQENNP